MVRLVPGNAHGRGAAAFHRGEHGVGLVVALELGAQQRQGLGHGLGHEGRQALPQVGPGDAGAVAGLDPAGARGGAAGQEVLHPLGRSPVVSAAQGEGGLLQTALEGNARQGIVAAEILRRDVDQQGTVDVGAVPGKFAHAVGDHPSGLGSGGHHLAAGADAEGEGGAATRQVAG